MVQKKKKILLSCPELVDAGEESGILKTVQSDGGTDNESGPKTKIFI